MADEDYNPDCRNICWSDLNEELNDDLLTFSCVNTRSLSNKFVELKSQLSLLRTKFTFLAITETWLRPHLDIGLELEGYKSISLNRNSNSLDSNTVRGGGIKLYFKDSLNVSVRHDYDNWNDTAEILFVKVDIGGLGLLNLCIVYRPPDKPIPGFVTFCNTLLEDFTNRKLVLMGDLNLDVLSDERSRPLTDFINTMNSFGFINEVNLPTYVLPSNNRAVSCLDHLWHNLSIERKSFVVYPNIADHFLILVCFKLKIKNGFTITKFRDFSEDNCSEFRSKIDREFSNFSPSRMNCDSFCQSLSQFLKKMLNKYFPLKKKKISEKRMMSPWLTRDVMRCIRKKHEWYKLTKRNIITLRCYKSYCDSLKYMLNLAEKEYFVNKFKSLGNNSRKNWQTLNAILNLRSKSIADSFVVEGNSLKDGKRIADEFNRFFVNKPVRINESVPPPNSDYGHLVEFNSNTFGFYYSNPDEISSVIKNIKKPGNSDDVPIRVFKMCAECISPLISELFNMCIDNGIYPNSLKNANITPIFKKGNHNCISNYRPVSVLSNLSKIFDTLIRNRLKSFFNSNELLSENQFGFRDKRNTELAVLNLMHRILNPLIEKSYTIVVFLDFSSCFDTICRDMLLSKLHKYGIRGVGYRFLKSYFENRTQNVKYNEFLSERRNQDLGVIQGSNNGPLLFDIYANDFNKLCTEGENIHFADDTCLIYTNNDFNTLVHLVNERLKVVFDWCNYNKMSLNPSKSEYMLFTNRKVPYEPQIVLGGDRIERKSSVKYLGIHIDSGLRFSSHVDNIKTALSRRIGISRKLVHYCNYRAASNFYYSMVFSCLSYGIAVWGGAIKSTYDGRKLVLQHERLVNKLFSKFNQDNCSVFKKFSILKLDDIYKYFVAIHMFKLVKMNDNPAILQCIEINYPTHSHRTRQRDLLVQPRPRLEVEKINFPYNFVMIWNEVPVSIANVESLGRFKIELKKYYIGRY